MACAGLPCAVAQTALGAAAVEPTPKVAAVTSAAQLPVERFFQAGALLSAKLSPSGQRLALSTSRGAAHIGLVVMELGATPKVHRTANFDDADIESFYWVSDERLIIEVRDPATGTRENLRLPPGLFSVKADGSDMRKLVKRNYSPWVSAGVDKDKALEWHHFLLHVPLQQDGVAADEVVVGNYQFADNEVLSVTPLWLNVKTGRTRPMPTDAPPHTKRWMFDSKGQPRVAVADHKGRTAVYWRGPDEQKWRKLFDANFLDAPFEPHAVDDAGTLYIEYNRGPKGEKVLGRFDFDSMAPQPEPLLSAQGFDFDGALVRDRAGARALGVRVHTDAEQTVWLDAGMRKLQDEIDARLPGRINRLSCRRCGADDMVVLILSYSDRDPGRLFLYEAAGKRWRTLGVMMDGIDPQQMAKVDFQRIKARDGRDLPVWLTLPMGMKPGQPVPTVVMVHGGPWVRGGYWRWNAFEQFLASRGYLVISPEFRGSTGYGAEHFKAGWKQWGQAMQDDVTDALRWAQAQGLADQRVCIAGASFGGYATLMGLVRDPALYKCGVSWVPVADLNLYLQGNWWVRDDISDTARAYGLPQVVGDAERDAAMLQSVSPVLQAKRIQAPLLLAAGAMDRRTPIAHAQRMRDALLAAGHGPEWVSYDDEGHGWRKIDAQIDFAKRVEQFLGRHLRP